MSGGGTTETKTDASAAPWKPAQPYLQSNMQQASNLYNQGIGSQVYTGSTVTPFSNQTMQSMSNSESLANSQASNLSKPVNSFAGMFDILNPIARGDFSNDTTFNSTLGAAQEAARNAVDQSASGVGRYGGGQHAATMAKAIGDLTNNAQLDRQAWALGGLNTLGQAMPMAYQTANMGNDTLAKIGGNYENLYANQLQDQLRIFDQTQNAPWDALARANAIYSGAGKMGGSQTQTVSSPTTPMWQQLGGFGLATLGALAPGGLF